MSNRMKLLFVEDDAAVRLGAVQALRLSGLEVQAFERAEHALPYIEFGFPGILVSDLRLPGMSGLSLMDRTIGTDASLPVILVTGHGDISMAVDAMRRGAYDFIEKPYSSEQLVDVSHRALEQRRLTLELAMVQQGLARRDNIEARILGRSPAIDRLRRMIQELADADANALILGETGTGKELVARSLHDYGNRQGKNFAAINCAGIPEMLFESEVFGHEAGSFTGAIKRRIGKIEYAHGGTLFLDEIETMQMSLQVKLLRLLQEKKFERIGSNDLLEMDCRIVAGSKADLLALSSLKSFRDDLYYRLGVVVLEIPPLRERREDIPLLFEHFVLHAAAEYNKPVPVVAPAYMRDLMSRPWPGNVRELRNVAERFTLGMPTRVEMANINDSAGEASLDIQVSSYERQLIEEALSKCAGRAAAACELLGVPKKTLYDKMRRLGIYPDQFK
jgi:two-component system C4-dicarboxylate transport response regulator DctD